MADCYCRQSLNAERQLIGFDQMESGLKPRLFNLLIAGFGAIRSKGTVGSDSILQFETSTAKFLWAAQTENLITFCNFMELQVSSQIMQLHVGLVISKNWMQAKGTACRLM